MLYLKINALRKTESNANTLLFLEGKYLFNGAIDYLANNPDDKGDSKESRVAQISNLEHSIEKLSEDKELNKLKLATNKSEIKSNSSALQKHIVDYVISQNYSDAAFMDIGRATNSIMKSGAVGRARSTNKKEDDKKCSEHYVLTLKYQKLGK